MASPATQHGGGFEHGSSDLVVLTGDAVLCTSCRRDGPLALPFAAVINPTPAHAPPSQCSAAPPTCSKCSAYVSQYAVNTPGSDGWLCCICMHRNTAPADFAQQRQHEECQDYVLAATGCGHEGPVRVLAVDLSSPPHDLDLLKEAAEQALSAAPNTTRVALLAYGSTVSVYRLDGGGQANAAVHADVLLPDSITSTQPIDLLDRSVHVAVLGACRLKLAAALKSLRSQSSRDDTLLSLGTAVTASITLSRSGGRTHASAASIEAQPTEQHMQRQSISTVGHVVLLTAAPGVQAAARRGNGQDEDNTAAERYLGGVAAAAAANAVVVDALAWGAPASATALAALTSGTGGLLRMHGGSLVSALAANLKSSLVGVAGAVCTLEVRCSSGLGVRRALGPLTPVCLAGKPAAAWHGGGSGSSPMPRRMLNRHSWHYVCAAPGSCQGVTLLLAGVSEEAAREHLYLQVALVWTREDGATVHRVATKRVRSTANPEEAVAAADFGVTALVLAKTAAADALARGAAHDRKEAEIARRGLGKQLYTIAMQHGRPDRSSVGWFSGPSRFVLPSGQNLAALAEAAYSLHFGPLLGERAPGGGNVRQLLLAQFVAAQLPTAERMCRPQLHVLLPPTRRGVAFLGLDALAGPALEFQVVPAYDLALLLSLAAVLDSGDTVFIWLSAAAGEQQRVHDACRQLAEQLAERRTPPADVAVVAEGFPLEREVLGRLMALGGDPVALRRRQLPLLAGFAADDIAAVVERLGDSAERPSLVSWLARHDVLLPAA